MAVDAERLQERIEFFQSQLGKAAREKETSQSELEASKERLEKAQQIVMKFQVRLPSFIQFTKHLINVSGLRIESCFDP